MNNKICLLFVCIFCTGCATQYSQPEESEGAASITITHNEPSYPSSTNVYLFDNQYCELSDGFGQIGINGNAFDLNDDPVTAKIKSGKRVYVRALRWTQSKTWKYSQEYYQNSFCVNVVSFIPVEGESYKLSIVANRSKNCRTQIYNKKSNRAPNGYKEHTVQAKCLERNF